MVMVAWRGRVTAALRAAIFGALREGLTNRWLGKLHVHGRGEGKALESKQPSKHARDHCAGQAPARCSKLCHTGMERLPLFQVNGDVAGKTQYSATVAQQAHNGRNGRFR